MKTVLRGRRNPILRVFAPSREKVLAQKSKNAKIQSFFALFFHSLHLPRISLPTLLLVLAVLAYATYFSHLSLTRYAAFESRALDMGNLDQTVWNTMEGRWFHLTNQSGTVNRLSLHVEPILIPISWLYRIHSGPETLLILQAVIVALGALPLFALANFKLSHEWFALVFALGFLLSPAIQAANWLEFHPLTLAPTFLMAAFYCLLTRRTGWYTAFAVLAASCKEEMALLIFMIGLYALAVLRRYQLAGLTVMFSLLWAFLAVFAVQNRFAAGNIHWGRYAYLGETPVQMVVTLLTRPDVVIGQLRVADALGYLAQLLLPVAYTPILAPEILALALPSLGVNLLADFSPMHQVSELIYAAPIAPFVFIAGVMGAARLAAWLNRAHHSQNLRFLVMAGLAVLILVGVLAEQRLHGYTPWGANYRLFTVTDHHRRAATIIAQIPPDAKVSAQDKLNPHVSRRETIYIFPRIDDADTIFLDVTGPAWPQHPTDLRAAVDELLADDFSVAAAEDGYLLLGKQAPTDAIPDTFYDAWRRPNYAPANPRQIEFDHRLRLIDYQVKQDSHDEVFVEFYWQALRPLGDDLKFYIAYLDADGNVLHDSLFYPPVATLWYPTSRWKPNVPVLVKSLPWSLEGEQFTLVVGLFQGEDGWSNGHRLRLTKVEPPLPRLEGDTLARLGGFRRNLADEWESVHPEEALPVTPFDARFGEQIILDGATLLKTDVQPGGNLTFTLYWHAAQSPAMDYTVFVHLLDAKGDKVAQLDWQPRDTIGRLPTSSWLVGEPVVDMESLLIPQAVAPGVYRLIVGLYNWQNGQRLPVGGTHAEPGDVVTVANVRVQ